MLGWARLRGQNLRMERRDLLAALLFGVIGQGIYQLLWAGSLGTINAGTSALLIAVTPFLTAIFASLLISGPWLITLMTDYMRRLITSIPTMVG